jgi:hypothetical protein
MYLLLGSSHMETNDYEGAVQSFERARAQMRPCVGPHLSAISLVSVLLTVSQHMVNSASLTDIRMEI